MPAHFNLTARAWRQLRRAWSPSRTASLEVQTYLLGGLHSGLDALQTAIKGSERASARREGSLFILGFWRSGTTLLHELLCKDDRFGFPSTYACLNPHHFLLTQSVMLARPRPEVRRPQDKMMVGLAAPQEDEFALLCLGARSPYEGLLVPSKFAKALALADPKDLTPADARRWCAIFNAFFNGVSIMSGGKPLILKSPAHSYRVATLRELLPDPRFVLIVRNPGEVLESMVRTYKALSAKYGLGPMLSDDDLREIIVRERIRFEAKLQAGVAGLPARRLSIVTFEQLIRNPIAVIQSLYRELELPPFEETRAKLETEVARRRSYVQESVRPNGSWSERIDHDWQSIFERYGYERQTVAG
jgi:omega-hydroxy-beta-dihydromenaquinone-9 sulfotransferase